VLPQKPLKAKSKMRKLVLIVLVLLSIKGFSQISYSQNFSTLTLNSYTATNGSGVFTFAPSSFITYDDSHLNNVGTFASPNSPFNYSPLKTRGWLVTYNAIENDTFLVSTSWLDSGSVASDKWIVGPPVTISAANTVLRWQAKAPDATYRDGYEVYITTVTTTPTKADLLSSTKVFSIADNNTSGGGEECNWVGRSALLDAYIGQTVRFAFRNNSTDRFQLWLDDIQVATVSNARDIAINKVEAKKYNVINVSDSVHVTFTNLGSTPITTLVLNYTYGTSSANSMTLTNALGWGNNSVTRVSFPQTYNFSSAGIHTVHAWASSVNGLTPSNTSDDQKDINVTIISANVPRTVLMEQFVSAYDGDGPDAQEKSQAINTPSLIVVNIHDNDSLEIVDAQSLFSIYKKKLSTALFDRAYFKDSNNVAVTKNLYDSLRVRRLAAVSPASVSIANKVYLPSTRQLIFDVKVDFVGEVKGDYCINAYLTENNVTGNPIDTSVNGFNQLNDYYSVPWSPYHLKGYFNSAYNSHVLNALQYKHNNVLIKAFDGMYGIIGPPIPSNGGTAGNSYVKTYTMVIPTAANNVHKYIEDNIYIVGFVEEVGANIHERVVLNAVKDKLTANGELIGMEENSVGFAFTMFPNPTSGDLYLNLAENQLNKNVLISVKDLLGRTIHSQSLYSNMHINELDLKHLLDGVYIVEMEQNGQPALPAGRKTSQKLIIQH
jgi:hypothetical protein